MARQRRTARGVLAAPVLLSASVLVGGYVEAVSTNDRVTDDPSVERAVLTGSRAPVVPPRENVTVVATDSNGDRVLEVDTNGTVVRSATIGIPYETERLGTVERSAPCSSSSG